MKETIIEKLPDFIKETISKNNILKNCSLRLSKIDEKDPHSSCFFNNSEGFIKRFGDFDCELPQTKVTGLLTLRGRKTANAKARTEP